MTAVLVALTPETHYVAHTAMWSSIKTFKALPEELIEELGREHLDRKLAELVSLEQKIEGCADRPSVDLTPEEGRLLAIATVGILEGVRDTDEKIPAEPPDGLYAALFHILDHAQELLDTLTAAGVEDLFPDEP